jgi:MFS family permease
MLDKHNWRWMLGLETLPAVFYFMGLFLVPRSPRWLIMKGEYEEAMKIMKKFNSTGQVESDVLAIKQSMGSDKKKKRPPISDLFKPELQLVITIGIVVAVLQQITGINSIFFYAPMIFEQSGIGTDTSFVQAILVGLVNLVFTVLAIMFIDKLGRKPLLVGGVAGITICMFVLAYSFNSATYKLSRDSMKALNGEVDQEQLESIVGTTYNSDVDFKRALVTSLGKEKAVENESQLIKAAISMNPLLILIGILGFVASFALSIGPVMWVLFSELFPNWIRGLAISFVGLINSGVSFLVQLVFPWELENLGSAMTFLIYGLFAFIGLILIVKILPETKGKTLEELEAILVKT